LTEAQMRGGRERLRSGCIEYGGLHAVPTEESQGPRFHGRRPFALTHKSLSSGHVLCRQVTCRISHVCHSASVNSRLVSVPCPESEFLENLLVSEHKRPGILKKRPTSSKWSKLS
jgi:hypothetical protein